MKNKKAFQIVNPETIPAYQIYQTYSEDEQKVLQVFAVHRRPVNQTKMAGILRALYKEYQIGPLYKIMEKSFRQRALNDGVLLTHGNLLYCPNELSLLLVMETIKLDQFNAIKKCSLAQIPYAGNQYEYNVTIFEREGDKIRRVQNALFEQKDTALLAVIKCDSYQYLVGKGKGDYSLLSPFSSPYFPFVFDSFSSLAQYLILLNDLKFQVQENGANKKQAVKVLENLIHKLKESSLKNSKLLPFIAPLYLLAEQYSLSGDFHAAEKLVFAAEPAEDDHQTAEYIAFRAKMRSMQGKYDEAIELFQASIAAIKKKTRKRKVALTGSEGIFYALALLAKNDPSLWPAVQQQLSIAFEEKNDLTFYLLNEFVSILSGKLHWSDANLLGRGTADSSPQYLLIYSLCYIWTDKKLPGSLLTTIKKASLEAKKSDDYWYFIETQLVLAKADKTLAEKSTTIDIKSLSWQPLIDLIRPIPQWQRILTSLQSINQKGGAEKGTLSEQASANSSRLTWRVYFSGSDCEFEAREQVFGKKGKWTAGRVVSLEKLHEETRNYDYLTAQDRLMCSAMESETEYQYYGRYPKTHYYATGLAFIKAAIGHPMLFLGNDIKQSLELSSGEAILEIQSSDNNIKLTMLPYSGGDKNYTVLHDSVSQAKLIELNAQHQEIAQLIGKKGITVPLKAKDQVMATITAIAPLLTIHSDIGDESQSKAKKVKPVLKPQMHIEPSDEGLIFTCFVQPFGVHGPVFHPGHGHRMLFSEIKGEALQTSRDLEAEKQTAEHILQHCSLLDRHSNWHWQLDDTEDALETLMQLQALSKDIELQWPQGETLKLNKQQHLKQMQVSLRKKRDWFELDGQLNLDDGQIIEMQDLLQLISASPGRFIKLKEGDFLALTEELRQRLSQLQFTGEQRQIHALAAPLVDELTDGMKVKAGKQWQTLLQNAEQAKNYAPQLPSTLQAQLRDYQLDGFKWLARLAHWGAGACLADDMGLGKTLQALALILTRAAQGSTLVIAPTSVCSNWLDEAARFAPTLNVKRFGDTSMAKHRQKMLDEVESFDLVVCSYGLLQSQAEKLAQVKWHTIVADEAQAFKNSQTKRSKAIMALQGDFKMILSGTPIENHLGELWNLYRFINPGLLGSIEHFNKQFASPIENNQDNFQTKEAGTRLKNLIKPFILRRLKTDVLTELPARTEITVHVELSKEETALYEALRRQAVEKLQETDSDGPGQQRIKILAEIMRLRRACCHPKLVMPEVDFPGSKLQAFAEIVHELKENHHKALVFSQFVGHLTIIREFLDQQKISYQYLDGSTTQKKRKIAIDAFQAGEGDLFLISLKAGGAGINLTAADYVIHMDPWWNPAVEDQASDRAHRIGQTRPVTIYRLVTQGTIEHKIVQLHQQKRELANNLLEGSEMSGKMSVDDMFNLIKESY